MGSDLSRRLVPDGLWVLVAPLLPSFTPRRQGGGTAPVNERAVFTAVVYALTSGCAWRRLPPTCGVSSATALLGAARRGQAARPLQCEPVDSGPCPRRRAGPHRATASGRAAGSRYGRRSGRDPPSGRSTRRGCRQRRRGHRSRRPPPVHRRPGNH
ncbi:transposase [Streptomyces sp. NPDC056835]|uniref:transposase n=1 Tax=Streptomyces sp. NPDC056835 TaxID=3345956 RepID=UPI0036C97199